MYLKMLVKDYKRKKVITIVLFVFMLLAATLAAAGTQMFLSLTGAMDSMFRTANTPHYTQFHSGSYDENFVRQWTMSNQYIKEWSIQKVLYPADASLFVNGSGEAMDARGSSLAFITQNESIDILLNLENEPVTVSDGQIAVPILFMKESGLKLGDLLTVSMDGYRKDYIINDFLRDSIYGSTMMTAKRFVLSANDYAEMSDSGTDCLPAFCFLLKDEGMLGDFTKEYQTSDMPQNEFFVDMALCRLAYGTANGIIIGLVLLCSLLLVLIAFLTLRYTILSTIEEDFREIGVMKAIGFKLSGIIRLYLMKYIFLATAACIAGFMLSQPLVNILSTELLLYLGAPDNGMIGTLAAIGSAALILVLILLFCLLTLRRIGKMTVIDAIRLGNIGETYSNSRLLALSRRRLLSVNMFIGMKEVLLRFKLYALLFIVYLLCSFICILPINVKNTMAEPESLVYFGFPVSDIVITGGITENNIEICKSILGNDADVTKWAVYTEEQYKLKNADGQIQRFRTSVGDQTLFSPTYSSGTPPVLTNEIALSYLLAKDLNKSVGDSVILEISGEERHMLVSGIYQDTSNGGRAMRSCLEQDMSSAFFWSASVNVSGGIDEKVSEYQTRIKNTEVSTLAENSDRFIGGIVSQMNTISLLLAIIAMIVSSLITALFIKMLTAKEVSQIAMMKSLGFTSRHLRAQYFTRIGIIILLGILFGTVSANVLGGKTMNAVMTTMGATSIHLVIKPALVYGLYPLGLLAVVCVTVFLSCRAIRNISISQINAE